MNITNTSSTDYTSALINAESTVVIVENAVASSRLSSHENNTARDSFNKNNDINSERRTVIDLMNEALKEAEKKRYDPRVIARKIARGRKVSKKERDFLEKTDPVLYKKAIAANESRKMTETQIRSAKTKEQMKRALNTAKMMGAAYEDADMGDLTIEGVKELEERYLAKKRSEREEKYPYPADFSKASVNFGKTSEDFGKTRVLFREKA